MLAQGLLLTAVGMGTVFIFLLVLIAMMSSLERVAALFPAPEEQTLPSVKADTAEIAAAVFIATRLRKQA